CMEFDNKYLFQTKNPRRINSFRFPEKSVICTTIESNRVYKEMGNSPEPEDRAHYMSCISYDKYVTIEPVMKFDLYEMVGLIKKCNPIQVNIGADSGKNNIPEPAWGDLTDLIIELNKFTTVKFKVNIKRLIQ
ncbi:MAG: hypothetical protein KAR38_15845, partial [Calditrichia bacterium]|nr:hypothetical protein [Calditrichia bacterium]